MVGESTYLCDRLPVHYAPSATTFVEGRRSRQGDQPGQKVLAMGDPDFSLMGGGERGTYIPVRAAAFEATGGSRAERGLQLARLPFTAIETAALGQAFAPQADVRQGLLATEAAVRREGPGRRVLHLATHALLDPASPLDSAVVLSMPPQPAPDNDGFLKAWEVFGLDLRGCDLVTLSACETAKGEVLSGEGVIGLTRAFLYAGAASVLCTQWSMADESTAALMVRFYEHYRGGDPKDVALQKAMQEIRTGRTADGTLLELPEGFSGWHEEWSQPYYWAPFVLVGEYQQTGATAPTLTPDATPH